MRAVLDKYTSADAFVVINDSACGAADYTIYDVPECYMFGVPLVCEASFESTVHDPEQTHTEHDTEWS